MSYKFKKGDVVNVTNPGLDFPWNKSVAEYFNLENWVYQRRVPEDSTIRYIITNKSNKSNCVYSLTNVYSIINPLTNEEYLMDEEGLALNVDLYMPNTKKIKSVKVSEIDLNSLLSNSSFEVDGEKIIVTFENKNNTRIEYEPELLKRPDGSLISEPSQGTECVVIYLRNGDHWEREDNKYEVEKCTIWKQNTRLTKTNCKLGLIFLKEDERLAEKKAKMLTKQLEIQYEIDRLNAEQGWNHKTCIGELRFFESESNKVITLWHYPANCNDYQRYMSPKTNEIICTKYSEDELKQYLGIII